MPSASLGWEARWRRPAAELELFPAHERVIVQARTAQRRFSAGAAAAHHDLNAPRTTHSRVLLPRYAVRTERRGH